MIKDAATIPAGASLRSDVCIVGAGPIGLTLATSLASATCHVIVLESGGLEPASANGLTQGVSVGDLWQPLAETRTRRLGGTSHQWTDMVRPEMPGGLRSYPLTPLDFEARSWVPDSGWPIPQHELDPDYAGAGSLLGVAPPPASSPPGPLDLRDTPIEPAVAHFGDRRAIEALELAARSSPYLELYLNATVLRLRDDDAGVRTAIVQAPTARFTVEARVFVVAVGGIESARLLLLSSERTPGGIGNQHDNVGRYFMEHLTVMQGEVVLEGQQARSLPVSLWAPPPRQRGGGWGEGFLDAQTPHRLAGWRLNDKTIEKEQLLSVTLWPVASTPTTLRNAYYFPWSRLAHAPRSLKGARLRRADRLAGFALHSALALRTRSAHPLIHAHIEQPPRRENRVTLSDRADSLGQRRARLEWRIGAQERDSLLRTLTIFDQALRSRGLGHLARLPTAGSFDLLVEQSHHHMGTTRMHEDPAKGVVDADCRVHGVNNLYIAGSSVMPTGGAATVTLTALALALRLADHLKKEMLSS